MTAATLPSPPTRRRALAVGALVVAAAALGLVLTLRSGAPPALAQVERTTPWLDDGVLRYPAAFAQREKIAFERAATATLTPKLDVSGSVTWDARRVVAVGARIDGRLRLLPKVEGDRVEKGEVVAELESAELGRAQAEVLKARAKEAVAKLDAEREAKLAQARISAERDAQFALANAEAATAERVAAERAVEALGGEVGGRLGVLTLRSPISGHVVEQKPRRGETVEAKDTVLVVADLSQVWVELTVFERDLAAMRVGDRAEVFVPSDRRHALEGVIAHVSEQIDPESRAGHARVELPNPDGRLRAGLSVTAVVHATGPRATVLTVPRPAVTRIDGAPTVFVRKGALAVEPRRVKVGADDGAQIAVLEGLAEGDEVVTSGLLALKAEVFR